MNADAVLLERLIAGAAIVLAMAGAVTAFAASNAIKRLIGVAIAGFGAVTALALWVPAAVTPAAAILFVYLAVGAALIVRVQEAYGSIETRDLDSADAAGEPKAGRE
jgi:hypothetical protein